MQRRFNRIRDGVGLDRIANAKSCNGTKQAEQDGQPPPVRTQSVLNVIHWATDVMSQFIDFPISNGQHRFPVLRGHAE